MHPKCIQLLSDDDFSTRFGRSRIFLSNRGVVSSLICYIDILFGLYEGTVNDSTNTPSFLTILSTFKRLHWNAFHQSPLRSV